jgi:phosphatidylethanolamine/phosphatidyl-N-methylethanolamine N-methyltransferase
MTSVDISSSLDAGNHRIARFYDRVHGFYPLVDCFCAPGRQRLIQHINQAPAGKLLEVGVGPGHHLPLYRQHEITAIDCSAKMVARCRRHASGIDVRQMDGECLRFPDATFDYLAICHVLSVTADPVRMLAEAHRVLRPGGRLFVLNHETPANAWRHLDTLLGPLSRWLCFRSWFRLGEVRGVERFQISPLGSRSGFGLMVAHSLQK